MPNINNFLYTIMYFSFLWPYSPHIFFILFIAISRLQDKRPLYLMCRFSSGGKVPAGFTA